MASQNFACCTRAGLDDVCTGAILSGGDNHSTAALPAILEVLPPPAHSSPSPSRRALPGPGFEGRWAGRSRFGYSSRRCACRVSGLAFADLLLEHLAPSGYRARVSGHAMLGAILTLWVRKNNSDLFRCNCQAPVRDRSARSIALHTAARQGSEGAHHLLPMYPKVGPAAHSRR